QHTQALQRPGGLPFVPVTPGPPGLAVVCGLGEDLVVDVGDIADQGDLQSVAADQPPAQDVEGHREPDVTDVRGTLGGEATDVDADPSGLQRHEVPQLAGGGVIEAQTHDAKATRAAPAPGTDVPNDRGHCPLPGV